MVSLSILDGHARGRLMILKLLWFEAENLAMLSRVKTHKRLSGKRWTEVARQMGYCKHSATFGEPLKRHNNRGLRQRISGRSESVPAGVEQIFPFHRAESAYHD